MAVLERQTLSIGEKDQILVDVDPKSEYVNFRVGKESKGELVKKSDLWAMIFTIADATTQEKMMPVRQTQVEHIRRIHRVKVTKDIRAGQTLNVKCEISVEKAIIEGLQGNLMKPRKSSSLILPGQR